MPINSPHKIFSRFLLALLLVGSLLLGAAARGETARVPAKQLDDATLVEREAQMRNGIIRLLKTDQRVKEKPDGTLEAVGRLHPWAQQQIDEANEDRLELFQRYKALYKEELEKVRAKHAAKYRKEDRDIIFPPARVELRIHGSDALSDKLIPALVESFYASRRYDLFRSTREAGAKPGEPYELRGCPPNSKDFLATTVKPNGESEAFRDLINKKCDLVMSTIPPPDNVKQELLRLKAGDFNQPNFSCLIARDGLSILAASANALAKIRLKDLEGIYSGRLTEWNKVEGSSKKGPIHVYHLSPESATHHKFLLGISSTTSEVKLLTGEHVFACADAGELMRKLSADDQGIGYASSADLGKAPPVRQVPLVSATGQELLPTRFTVRTDYPLQREFYLLVRADCSDVARQFVNFALEAAGGQKDILKAGFVDSSPLLPEERVIVRADLDRLRKSPQVAAGYRKFLQDLQREDSPFNIRFGSNSALMESSLGINVASQLEMRQLVDCVSTRQSVVLAGHTDRTGRRENNLRLALARCEAVAGALRQLGLKVDAVTTANCFVDEVPVGDNTTELGKSLNRRVEIWIRPR
jgi:phosphate transport system substrate-binding protein